MKLKCLGNTTLFAMLLMSALPLVLQAQSIYSRRGFGLIRYRDDVKAISMGGVSLATSDSVSIFFLNPATMASVSTTHIQGGFLYDRTSFSQQGANLSFQEANVNSVSLLLPIKRGYTLAFGLQPYSRVDYAFSGAGAADSTSYTESLVGSGGVDNVFISLSGTLAGLRFGLASDFYFGLIERTWSVRFSNSLLSDSEDAVSTKVRGVGLHGGLQAQIGNWEVGGAAGAPVDLSSEISLHPSYDNKITLESRDLKLPAWYGVGVGYHPNQHWLLGAQWRRQQWASISSDKLLDAQGVNVNQFSFGFELIPSFDPLDGFFKKLQYRCGFSQSQLPYQEVGGLEVSEWLLTGGIGVPFNRGLSRIDFAVEFGRRGENTTGLARENIFRFSASVSGSERWFQRRQRN